MDWVILTAILGVALSLGAIGPRGHGIGRAACPLSAARGPALDGATVAGWRAACREMRQQASSWAEKPPLTSY